jgi:hypothetical protein
MSSYSYTRLQWVLSGTLSASLALAPALAKSAFAQTSSTGQQAQTPGQQGDWGQAGPPPDVQNGQIPAQDTGAQNQNDPNDPLNDQGPPQYPGQPAGQTPAAPAPGYGQQAPRPSYQPAPGQQYPNQQYQGQQQQGPPLSAEPTGPVTLNSGQLLSVRTSEPLDSKRLKAGDYFQGTVAQAVYVGNVIAIPRGAEVTGRVVDVKKPGELKGGANIALQLTSLSLGGNSFPLATDVFNTGGPGKGGYTAGTTVGTAALGAVVGAIAGGGPGAAIGAVAGTGVGLGASAATPGPRSIVPPEALVSFHLTSPATVQPLSAQDAYRLQASSAPPAPQGRGGYPPPYAYGPGPVGYPPPPPAAYGYAPYPYAYPYPYGYRYYRGPYPYGRVYYYGR